MIAVLGNKRRQYLLIAGIIALAALYVPVKRSISAVRLLLVVRQVAAGDLPRSPAVLETSVYRGSVPLHARVYRPAGTPTAGGVILVPGVSELGCDHPRLVSLARALAQRGLFVITPDIKRFRTFQIYPPPTDEITFWLQESGKLDGSRDLKRIGLAGISFSGTLALIAAADEKNRGRTAYVLAIGAFEDLMLCSRFWFDAGPVTVGTGCYPTRFYAKWIMMLAASNLLSEPADRIFIETVVNDLLLQKQIPEAPATLTDAGRRWLRLALLREDQADPELAQQIRNRIAELMFPGLETRKPAAEIRCPVFLAHGAFDDLIPAEESRRLQAQITNAKSYLLVTPFLTHTHPLEKKIGTWTKTRAVVGLFAFFYHLAGVV